MDATDGRTNLYVDALRASIAIATECLRPGASGHTPSKMDRVEAWGAGTSQWLSWGRPQAFKDAQGCRQQRKHDSIVETEGGSTDSWRPPNVDCGKACGQGRRDEPMAAVSGRKGSWTQLASRQTRIWAGSGQQRKHVLIVAAVSGTTAGQSGLFFWHAARESWTGTFVGPMSSTVGTDLHDTAAAGNPANQCNAFFLARGGRTFHRLAPAATCLAEVTQFSFKA